MLIDWFTVAAQLVNFFILVYLLKRFLFKPIVGHMLSLIHISEPTRPY